ncbi:signal peptidase I [Flavobacterium urocaniciphilum]|uniref:Signal peptidase I n=1 Tax=Flavobacterium urocaniciphilum TaxID=1299341 RepID=A0A1H9E791_9FLAO|nr:signal peptidase I [Flavobacterium urocaniciphilum]SEQ21505.1 signal peptidase I [Flavobacterium urocaniciphilum]
MEISSWIITILIISTIHGICTWKLYLKANRQAWEAFIPVYNGIVMMQIVNRPKWWILLLFIPIINLLILPVIWIETLRTFGKKTTADMWLGIVSLGLYIGYVNYTQEVTYIEKRDTKPATKALDTLGSLSFALIVATFVHTYFIQPFVIPTSSLEKTLLVGDFLFVSKFHYGARTPITTVAAPMVHDTIPVIKTKSYLERPQLPYFRFPGFQKIERNDIVVFNWPTDTLYHMYKNADKKYYKPIDKKTNYVKRCTAIPGDKLEIKNGILFINGKESILPERSKVQYSYKIAFDNTVENIGSYLEQALVETESTDGFRTNETKDTLIVAALTKAGAEKFKSITGVKSVEKIIATTSEDGIFPDFRDGNAPKNRNWNLDNMGPIYIPEAGKTVALNKETLPFYKMIITEYEHHKLEVNGNEIKIDGKPATSYTFAQNYYWMMGDNRHNSLDARYFGFTPEDHIVGKPIFIWMSFDIDNRLGKPFLDRFRTDRFFTTVSGDGEPQSYFKYFLIALAGYFAWDWYRGKKKKKEAETL